MKLHCPDCGAMVSGDDANLDTGMAWCRVCDGVFSFRSAVESQERVPAAGRQQRALVGRPARMMVDDWGATCRIRWRWFGAMYVGLLVFAIAWDSFLIFWYSMAFRVDAPWIMVVFPVGHLAVGVGITYTVLTGLLNSTVIEVGSGTLSIRHGPLPWRGNRTLAAMEIEQLFCDEASYNRQQRQRRYRLRAVLRDGRNLTLLSSWDADDVLFLEQQIEEKLGIADREVAGEM